MQELRLVAVSEDGQHLIVASTDRGTRFALPVDDRLRAAVRGQFSRLGPYEIEVENPLRPKEIQARIRSGETAEAISEVSGIAIERVRWFEGPVLQEREYMAQQAQRATVRSSAEAAPGPPLSDLVTARIGAAQVDSGTAVWDSWKLADTTWRVRLTFDLNGQQRVAHWTYDPRRRSVVATDEEAERFTTGATDPEQHPAAPWESGTNVTPLPARRSGSERSPVATPPEAEPPPAPPAPPRRGPAPETPAVSSRTSAEQPDPEPHPEEPTHSSPANPASSGRPSRPFPTDAPSILTPPQTSPVAPPATPPSSSPAPERSSTDSVDDADTDSTVPPRRPAAAAAGTSASNTPNPANTATTDTTTTTDTVSTEGTPEPESESDQAKPARRTRAKGRGRRASVPSWDEIMFGSRKQD